MINLITTDSYFNIFEILVNQIEKQEKNREINPFNHNLVFCEEKVSLMIERMICHKLGGSFNTDVYSFGNYLRAKKSFDKVLSKEGSSMAVQRILRNVSLKLFRSGKNGLAPTLYELIILLKSAKVTPQDIFDASKSATGLLANKLKDIYTVYGEYEKYIEDNNFEDQSSILSHLDELLSTSEEVAHSNIFVVGFTGFTAQLREAISILMDRGLSFTAILTEGDNSMAFVNETCEVIKKMAKDKDIPILKSFVKSPYSPSAEIIKNCLFNPTLINHEVRNRKLKGVITASENADRVMIKAQPDIETEIRSVGEIIKKKVINGERYRNMTIAVPDTITYGNYIKDIFFALDIPYFLDEKKKPDNHPLITLILSYIEMYRRGFDRKDVLDFARNPLFESDKTLGDKFENYVLKYNITRGKFREPFTMFDAGEDEKSLNEMRERLVKYFDNFNVINMLTEIDAENKLIEFSNTLESLNELEEKAVNDQIYSAVTGILDEMELMLKDVKLSIIEYKNTFLSGISALQLSIIPQYNDAVFVGNFKEVALYKAKYLFVMGLTSNVPDVKMDVALLSDNDIDTLKNIKVMVDPKIEIINKRTKENIALALSAFDKELYLSYPVSAPDGDKNEKSEIITEISAITSYSDFPLTDGYLTYREGINSFATQCGEFSDCKIDDIKEASSFYKALLDGNYSQEKKEVDDLLNRSRKEITLNLTHGQRILIDNETSPTLIEDYHKCPYSVFLSRGLRLTERIDGSVDPMSLGSFMHEVFKIYAENIEKIDQFNDNTIFEKAFNEVLGQNKFNRFLSDINASYTVGRIKKECRRYCHKILSSINNSYFKVYKTEAGIGDDLDIDGNKKPFPALAIADGKVKIKGNIDRIDLSKDYYRIIDYKSGKVDDSDRGVFSGTKLQLFLYAKAVDEVLKKEGKKLAGCYYLPVWENYCSEGDKKYNDAHGKSLNEKEALAAQGAGPDKKLSCDFLPRSIGTGNNKGLTESQLNDYMDYAIKISSLAVKRMSEGFIVASPYNDCDYCKYKGFCNYSEAVVRKINKVATETIVDAVKGDKKND